MRVGKRARRRKCERASAVCRFDSPLPSWEQEHALFFAFPEEMSESMVVSGHLRRESSEKSEARRLKTPLLFLSREEPPTTSPFGEVRLSSKKRSLSVD